MGGWVGGWVGVGVCGSWCNLIPRSLLVCGVESHFPGPVRCALPPVLIPFPPVLCCARLAVSGFGV